jgi:HPt (histidine-containing phosphotransfer) domain-containing protein
MRGLIMVDWEVARRLTGGDEELLRELIEMFPAESRKHLEEVRLGVERQDAEMVRRGAHSLKSAGGLFGAETLVNRALEMEAAAAGADLADAAKQLEVLEEETARLTAELAAG